MILLPWEKVPEGRMRARPNGTRSLRAEPLRCLRNLNRLQRQRDVRLDLALALHHEGVLFPRGSRDDLAGIIEPVETDVTRGALRHEELDEELPARGRGLVGH